MTNADRIRALYDALRRGDTEGFLAQLDPACEWRWPAAMLEGGGSFRGTDEIRHGLEMWAEAWEDPRMEPTEILEHGDQVFAIVHYTARGRQSGLPLDADVAHLWTLRGGRPAPLRMFGRAERAKERWLAETG